MLHCCLKLPSIGALGAANRAVVYPSIAEGARNAGVSDARAGVPISPSASRESWL